MRLICATAISLLPVMVQADPVFLGEAIVRQNCAACHGVTQDDASPNPRAIPFRFLGRLYPLHYLEEALVEGITVGHEMPEFVLDTAQMTAVIEYLESIQLR
jgi:cytochrome c